MKQYLFVLNRTIVGSSTGYESTNHAAMLKHCGTKRDEVLDFLFIMLAKNMKQCLFVLNRTIVGSSTGGRAAAMSLSNASSLLTFDFSLAEHAKKFFERYQVIAATSSGRVVTQQLHQKASHGHPQENMYSDEEYFEFIMQLLGD